MVGGKTERKGGERRDIPGGSFVWRWFVQSVFYII